MPRTLHIDSSATAPRVALDDDTIETDRYYPFDDTHRLMVRKLSPKKLRIEILRGKTRVQTGEVHLVSPTTGRDQHGNPRLQVASFQLNPVQPIATGSKTIEALLRADIGHYEISRLSPDGQLMTNELLQADPQLLSDGKVVFEDDDVQPGDDLLVATRRFQVVGASWVVAYHSVYVSGVYLRPDADEHIADLMAAIDTVRGGYC